MKPVDFGGFNQHSCTKRKFYLRLLSLAKKLRLATMARLVASDGQRQNAYINLRNVLDVKFDILFFFSEFVAPQF